MPAGKHPLAFLGKKSWHTKNIKNVEKVWIAEQKEEAERKKLADLQKQIMEERQIDELRQMQVDAGIQKKGSEKLDWMYEGPMGGGSGVGVSAAGGDEYLLGKAFESKASKEEVTQNLSARAEQPPQAKYRYKNPSANEMFTRMHEDPMMQIRQQELQAREMVAKNPLKMNRVKAQIQTQLKREKEQHQEQKRKKKNAKKGLKKDKKEAKREKKKFLKQRRRRRGRGLSSTSGDGSDSDNGGCGCGSGGDGDSGERHRRGSLKDARSGDGSSAAVGTRTRREEKDPRFGLQNGKRSVYCSDELGPSMQLRQAKEARNG